MNLNIAFFITSVMLGLGLSMDAFSISLVAGLSEPGIKKRKTALVAGTFSFFQALMPMLGWVCVHTVLEYFEAVQKYIPIVAFLLLTYIGLKMIIETRRPKDEDSCPLIKLTLGTLLLQAVATSIDALSVGFKIVEYSFAEALISAVIIAAVTFVICFAGVIIGKKTGTLLSGKANILGGSILIIIGLQILLDSII